MTERNADSKTIWLIKSVKCKQTRIIINGVRGANGDWLRHAKSLSASLGVHLAAKHKALMAVGVITGHQLHGGRRTAQAAIVELEALLRRLVLPAARSCAAAAQPQPRPLCHDASVPHIA